MTDGDDLGVSKERTALAWQRTALSIVAGAAIMGRLTWSQLHSLTAVTLGGAFLLSGWVFSESRRRYAHDAGSRSQTSRRGGGAAGALAAGVVLMAMTQLAVLITS